MQTRQPQTDGLPPGIYGADDLVPGDVVLTGERLVTAAMIDAYAALSGDAFEIHMSEAAAAQHGFPTRVAHGIMVLGLADGLKNQADAQIHARASLGWEVRFTSPVLAGDTIAAVLTITDIRSTKTQGQAVVRFDVNVTKQTGETVLSGSNALLTYR